MQVHGDPWYDLIMVNKGTNAMKALVDDTVILFRTMSGEYVEVYGEDEDGYHKFDLGRPERATTFSVFDERAMAKVERSTNLQLTRVRVRRVMEGL